MTSKFAVISQEIWTKDVWEASLEKRLRDASVQGYEFLQALNLVDSIVVIMEKKDERDKV